MSNVIYVDILLMINLLVNFLMLSAAGLLVKTPTRSWRMLLSAAIGAVYSLIIFLLPCELYSLRLCLLPLSLYSRLKTLSDRAAAFLWRTSPLRESRLPYG